MITTVYSYVISTQHALSIFFKYSPKRQRRLEQSTDLHPEEAWRYGEVGVGWKGEITVWNEVGGTTHSLEEFR